MAEKPSPTVPSNEQIIEDLTKDLENSCRTDDSSTKNDTEKGKIADEDEECSDFEVKEGEQSEEVPEDEDKPEDFVDEEALKDREVILSEDDKEKLRTEANVLKNAGNDLFKSGEFHKATMTYTEGLNACPLAFANDRAVLYANRAAAKIKYMEKKETALQDCDMAVELNPTYLKAYLRRANLLMEEKKLNEALADFKTVLELDPSHSEANDAVGRLPRMIEEENKKMVKQMLGQLKEIGNMILNPFGLSTNNFDLQENPEGGGYSVKFNQNPR